MLTLLGTMYVNATGETATSNTVLQDDTLYLIKVTGGYNQIANNGYADAEFFQLYNEVNQTWGEWLDVDPLFGDDLGVRLGDVENNHNWANDPSQRANDGSLTYQQLVTGTGLPLTARYHDSIYTDNNGSFTISIHTGTIN